MHREISAPVEDCGTHGTDEDPGPAHRSQRCGGDVAVRGDADEFDVMSERSQRLGYVAGLTPRQGRAASCQAKLHHASITWDSTWQDGTTGAWLRGLRQQSP